MRHFTYASVLLPMAFMALGLAPVSWTGSAAQAADLAWDGYTSLRYDQRNASLPGGGTASDADAYGTLRLDMTQPEAQALEFHFMGTVRSDLDGGQNEFGYSPFEGSGDTGDRQTIGYLYEAHLDVNYLFRAMRQLRLGRQAGTRDETIYFDGLAADFALSRNLDTTIYVGRAVHFFEMKGEVEDDALAGIGVDYRPFRPTRLAFDYLATHDVRDPDTGDEELDDRQVSLRWWQRFGAKWRGYLRSRHLNEEPRDTTVSFVGYLADDELILNGSFFRQHQAQNELSIEFSNYFDVIGRSEPYDAYDLKLRWLISPHYGLDLGYYTRMLSADAEEGPFNRDFSRTFLIFDMTDRIVAGMTVTLVAERWEATTTSTDSTGFDVGYRFSSWGRWASVNAGTTYSLYKYDYYTEVGERTEVQTTYVKGKLPVGDSFTVNAGYEQEDGIETFTRLTAGAKYEF